MTRKAHETRKAHTTHTTQPDAPIAHTHVAPLHITSVQTPGCYYHDEHGCGWPTFSGPPVACGFCGATITGGYHGPDDLHICAEHVTHAPIAYDAPTDYAHLTWRYVDPCPTCGAQSFDSIITDDEGRAWKSIYHTGDWRCALCGLVIMEGYRRLDAAGETVEAVCGTHVRVTML